ncbi:MAG: maleylpyruvate isomerase N-terminal domain-containing protein [Actinomycetota bacterium]|nr:maleylpyruvate isomerase N-terminal domain-containing protein [Actinomycetota bacterium]
MDDARPRRTHQPGAGHRRDLPGRPGQGARGELPGGLPPPRAGLTCGDPAAVAQRGRKAGAALGVDPAEAVEEITARVLARVDAAKDDVVVATPVGGMRLGDYLPTRTFELTVHTCDLAAALGQPLDVQPAAAVNSLTLLGELAARAGPLLLAGTGRGGLPDRFTAL